VRRNQIPAPAFYVGRGGMLVPLRRDLSISAAATPPSSKPLRRVALDQRLADLADIHKATDVRRACLVQHERRHARNRIVSEPIEHPSRYRWRDEAVGYVLFFTIRIRCCHD